jgi:hypothetical protein
MQRRWLETSELVLMAMVLAVVDLLASIHVALYLVLTDAYSYVSSVPILMLFATKAALTAKSAAPAALTVAFWLVKLGAFKPPRADRAVRTAMYAYMMFVAVANFMLALTLETLGVPPIISQIPG